MRNRSEPSQVTPGRFRARVNGSCPEGIRLLLRASTAWVVLAVPERGSAWEIRREAGQRGPSRRGGHGVEAWPVVNSRNAGDVKNDTAGLRAKGNLRVKRSDPWHRANARQSAVAVPALNGRDAETQSQACL
jgi:hypothetical protein